jgi:chromate transporter
MNQHPPDPTHAAAESAVSPPPSSTLQEIAQTFLSLGLTAFGGPAAHIAMMETELVRRRQWLSREHYLDLVGLASLVPGPNSTEVAIHLGRVRGGWRGLLIAGSCFILPAMILVWGLAIAYVQFQTVPVLQGLLYGVKPVVLAIIVLAFWKLMRTAIKDYWLAVLAVAVAIANWFGISELLLLVLGGLAYLGVRFGIPPTLGASAGFLLPTLGTVVPTPMQWQVWQVFLYFLKIGSVLYGSGYVLLAFLQNDLVEKLKLLSSQELLDAVAIGQVTPGPVFTTATFIPAFIFVALTQFGIERLRNVQGFRSFLDGVNAAALALMAVVSVKLGIAAFIDPLTIGLGLLSFGILLWQPKLNSAWLVIGGAVVGVVAQLGFQR